MDLALLMSVKMSELKIRVLNRQIYGTDGKELISSRMLKAAHEMIISPKSDFLIPLGVTFKIPEGFILDLKLEEDLIDKSLGLIGYTFAPMKMGYEFGIMVFNYNKQSIRIEESDDIASFNLIKTEKVDVSIAD